jgi:hypothetical protein
MAVGFCKAGVSAAWCAPRPFYRCSDSAAAEKQEVLLIFGGRLAALPRCVARGANGSIHSERDACSSLQLLQLIKAVLCLHTDEPGKARQDGRVRPDRRQGLSQEVGGLSNRTGMTVPFQQQDKLDENNSSDGSGWQPASISAPHAAAA